MMMRMKRRRLSTSILTFRVRIRAPTKSTLPPPPHGTPQPELPRARLTRFTGEARRVELGVLIQGDGVAGVWATEDVAAVPAVVFAREEGEC